MKDYALLSLLLMISRVMNQDFYPYKDKIDRLGTSDMQYAITSDGDYSRTLYLLTISGEIFNIFFLNLTNDYMIMKYII